MPEMPVCSCSCFQRPHCAHLLWHRLKVAPHLACVTCAIQATPLTDVLKRLSLSPESRSSSLSRAAVMPWDGD